MLRNVLKGLVLFVIAPLAISAPKKDCYSDITYMPSPTQKAERALYILVDQTLPLPETMRQKITSLVDSWGQPGDRIKIVKFSTNMKGHYPELVFDEHLPKSPNEEYWYNLRYEDRKKLQQCLGESDSGFHSRYLDVLNDTLSATDSSIPKTELLFTLKEISKQLIDPESAASHTVLFISDGLENSSSMSFYKRGRIRKLDVRGVINKIRREGLIGFWKGANIYAYGLGLSNNEKKQIKTEALIQLRAFWEQYFVEGGGKIKALGMPELLISKIE